MIPTLFFGVFSRKNLLRFGAGDPPVEKLTNMKRFTKAIAAIMLLTAVVFAAGCNPEDEPDNNGNTNGGGCNISGGIGTYNGHEYVDLGLPSGTLWATCNVGASTPEGYGDYFAWGETSTKNNYDWNTYKYCDGSSELDNLTKYCNESSYGHNGFTDNLTDLQTSDDAATASWGYGWRMPTEEQWEELIRYTDIQWVTQKEVKGCLFTASNGYTLFLPAAGQYFGNHISYTGSLGGYWSTMLDAEYPQYAWTLSFNSNNHNITREPRYSGHSVRPVCGGGGGGGGGNTNYAEMILGGWECELDNQWNITYYFNQEESGKLNYQCTHTINGSSIYGDANYTIHDSVITASFYSVYVFDANFNPTTINGFTHEQPITVTYTIKSVTDNVLVIEESLQGNTLTLERYN